MAIFGIDLWLIVSKALKCVISISIGIIIYKFIKRTIIKLTTKSKTRSKYKQKRLQTIQSLLQNLTKCKWNSGRTWCFCSFDWTCISRYS